jgi:general secretion pathway protein D
VGAGVGGAVTSPVTSFQYQDIGIKIEVEPRVHHNKEVTLKLMVEVSNQEGYAPGTTQPQFGTRTISSNIRLKDGETNFLAGLYRVDKSDVKNTIPFIGDIPIIGLLFTHNNNDHHTTDLVLTLTPHIIRIPDVTEEDVTPYFVGTDSNISYQGGPRVENPTRDNGPFEQPPAGARVPPPNQGRTPPQPAPQAPAIPPLGVPGSAPTDIFKPPPASPPPGSPQAQVPPQSSSLSSSSGSATVATKSEAADAGSDQALFDFDPPAATLAVGAQQSILVRATTAAALTGSTVAIRFDPAVVTPVVVRPILGNGSGTADAVVQKDHIVIQFPSAEELGGTRALAEITLRGVAPGHSTLVFEPTDISGAAVLSTPTVIDVQ